MVELSTYARVTVAASLAAVLLLAAGCADADGPPRVEAVSHWGHCEEIRIIDTLDHDYVHVRLGPGGDAVTHELDGHAITLELVEAYEQRPPGDESVENQFCARTVDHCEDSEAYMRLRVNGREAVILREQLKLVTLSDGYTFLLGAKDIEDQRDGHPSDLALVRFK